jgi:hypothetical protein
MNMTNTLQIKAAIISHVLDRFITVMNSKHFNRLSIKIISTQINISNK